MNNHGHPADREIIAAILLRDAATPEGADAAALAKHYTDNKVTRVRVSLGLFRGNRAHSRRYFLTQEAADSFTAGHKPRSAGGKTVRKEIRLSESVRERTVRARWDADTPAVITADTKVTIAPPPPTGYYKSNWFKGQ